MPIRPENRGRYPADWPEISSRIRFVRAQRRCECEGECGRGTHTGRCPNVHGQPPGSDVPRLRRCVVNWPLWRRRARHPIRWWRIRHERVFDLPQLQPRIHPQPAEFTPEDQDWLHKQGIR